MGVYIAVGKLCEQNSWELMNWRRLEKRQIFPTWNQEAQTKETLLFLQLKKAKLIARKMQQKSMKCMSERT